MKPEESWIAEQQAAGVKPVINFNHANIGEQSPQSVIGFSKLWLNPKVSGHINESAASKEINSARRAVFQPRCLITEDNNKEAYSALQRATTVQCKQEIADVVCLSREGVLFPQKELPNYCPLRSK